MFKAVIIWSKHILYLVVQIQPFFKNEQTKTATVVFKVLFPYKANTLYLYISGISTCYIYNQQNIIDSCEDESLLNIHKN